MAIVFDQSALATRDEFAGRIMSSMVNTIELTSILLGERLNLYRTLDRLGWSTSAELSDAASTTELYTREWLEQQADAGILDRTDSADGFTRAYAVRPGIIEALSDPDGLAFWVPVAQQAPGIASVLDDLTATFFIDELAIERESNAHSSGTEEPGLARYADLLANEWLPALPAIHDRLSDPARLARVADIGADTCWSSIAIAQAYEDVHIDGVHAETSNMRTARIEATWADVADRVRFHAKDASHTGLVGPYDLVIAFNGIDAMPNPIAALREMRRLAGTTGYVLFAEELTDGDVTVPAEPMERYRYGTSVLHALPNLRTAGDPAATGNVMRHATLSECARQAGFARAEILPIGHPYWRFYRLHPNNPRLSYA